MSQRRLSTLLFLVFVGLILSGFTQNAALINLLIPVLAYLAVSLLNQPGMIEVEIDRQLTQNLVNEQTEIQVKLSITNRGNTLEELHIEDTVPLGLQILSGQPCRIVSLAQGDSVSWEYSVAGNRGQYRFGTVNFTAYDLFGLIRKNRQVQANEQVEILPTLQRMDRVTIRPQRTRGFAGPIPSGQAGSGTAFFGLREYQAGDPQRWINWRVSERHQDRMYSNQFERERIADVGLILDARIRNETCINGHSLFEYSVKAAGSVAQAFLDDGHRVALLVYGRGLEWVTPGYGKVQHQRLMRQLAKAQVGDSQAFDRLDYLPTQMFPAKSQIVLFSPLNRTDVNMLAHMRARGYSVTVISPSPVAFEMSLISDSKYNDTALRLAQLERALLITQIKRSGVFVVDWDIRQSLTSVMSVAIRTQRSGRL